MSTAIATANDTSIVESVIAAGDLSKLPAAQRTQYYAAVCNSLGLNPLTKPFEYITLNGKLTLYARKDATDQLRKLHSVSVHIASRERIDDVYTVTARATDARGRTDESIGAVAIGSLKGDALCNAIMKAETKAKRRVTLSICGLGMLDEAELETIPQPVRQPEPIPVDHGIVVTTGEVVPFHEPERQVKLEGAQPTSEPAWLKATGIQGQIFAKCKALYWTHAQLAEEVHKRFKVVGGSDDPVNTLDMLDGAQLKELDQALAAEFQNRSRQ